MSLLIFTEQHQLVYQLLTASITATIRELCGLSKPGGKLEDDLLCTVFSPLLLTASLLHDTGDSLELTEQNGLLTRYLRVHGLRIFILWSTEGKELDAKTIEDLSGLSELLVRLLRSLAGPDLTNMRRVQIKNKVKCIQTNVSYPFLPNQQDQDWERRKKFNLGFTSSAFLEESRRDWWQERCVFILNNIKSTKRLDGEFSEVHLLFFNSSMDLICNTNLNNSNTKNNDSLSLEEIQVYMRCKYFPVNIQEGGLEGGWEDSPELYYLAGLSPCISYTMQIGDMYVCLLLELKCNPYIKDLIHLTSDILFGDSSNEVLRKYVKEKATSPVDPLLGGGWEVTRSSAPSSSLRSYHNSLVQSLANHASTELNRLTTTKLRKVVFLIPLERFLELKLRAAPNTIESKSNSRDSTSSSSSFDSSSSDSTEGGSSPVLQFLSHAEQCFIDASRSVEGLMQLQFYNLTSRKCLMLPREGVEEWRVEPLQSSTSTRSDLHNTPDAQIFRLSWSLEHCAPIHHRPPPSLAGVAWRVGATKLGWIGGWREKPVKAGRTGRVSAVCILGNGVKVDMGSLAIYILRFYSRHLIHCLS